MVDELPEPQKEAMTLHYCRGLSHSEVASVLELPAGTVATRIHSGLQSLRTRLAAAGVTFVGLTLEEALSSAEAAVAPASILSSVLREAAPGVLSGAGAAGAVQGGILVAKTKVSVLVAVAVACSVGGGVAGYGLRATRAERELAAMESSAPPKLVAAAPKNAVAVASTPAPATPVALPAPAAGPALPAAPSAPKETSASKMKKLASFLAKAIKMAEPGTKKVDLDPKEAQEFLALMADPELGTFLGENGKGALPEELGSDLYLALFEEFNVHLDEAQKAQFQQLFTRMEADHQALEGIPGTAVDRRIAELQSSKIVAEKISSLLTPQQRENARVLLQLHDALGQGVPVDVESPDRAVPALLESWSRSMIRLDDGEKARLAQTAAVHAGRLTSLQAELASQHGSDFIDRLGNCLGYKAEFYAPPDPILESKARDAYARFLELERQNRLDLMAALPERAEAIRKAEANVYLLKFKR
jgi:hypothetical protein